jgi:peptidoglycan/LPS O-acetylase OafA/YrhL
LIEQGFHVVPRVFVYGLPACMLLMGLVRLERNADQANLVNGNVPVSNEGESGRGHPVAFQAPPRFSALAGGASYAIYLSHILILTVVWNIGFNQLIASWSGNMIIAAYLVLMLSILGYSMLHYVFLEKPLHQLFKKWIGLYPTPRRTAQQN